MKNIFIKTFTVLCFLSSNLWAEARENNPKSIFDMDIFSLSKKKEDAFDAPSATYILTSEDIRRSGATSIPEALRLVPGLQVARIDGQKWAISARGFNNQYSNKLLIMIDGRTVYTPVFSGAFWDVQDYVLQDIEKIEVVRGPGGTIWGANAVNGIINIITKNAVNTQGGYASVIAGNQDQAIAEVRYGSRFDSKNHYRLYAKQVNRDQLTRLDNGLNNDDGYRESQAGFRYDIRQDDGNISIHGDVRDGRTDNYFQSVDAAKPTHKDSKGGNIVVNWEKTLSKKSSFNLQTYLDYDQFDTYILARDGRTVDVDFQHFYNFSKENQFAWGAGYRLIRDSITERPNSTNTVIFDYRPDSRNDEIFSAFIQDKIGLIADELYLTLGSKFEHNDFTGVEYQPNAKLTYYPSRNQTIWASVSKAVRTPTRGEAGGLKLLNSQNSDGVLSAENVTAFEVGYRIKPIRTVLIDIATYYNKYDSLRTFEPVFARNLGSGQSYGGEATAKWQVNGDWKLEAGYDFLKLDLRTKPYSVDRSFSLAEGQSPENQFRFRSNYNLTSKIEFDNIFYYVDSLPLSGSSTGIDGVPSYTRLDTRIGYMLKDNVDLSVGIQNIADNRHQEFGGTVFSNKTEVGRTFYVKVALGL